MLHPTWFHHDEDDHDLVLDTSLTTHERCYKGNIGDGASLIPLVDYFTNDCLHDVDTPIPMLHASATSSCLDLPIYVEYDDEHVELPSCDPMLHRISCENSIGHTMFDNPLTLSYAMSEISHIALFQSQHSDYACPITINPICTYGIDDEMMVIAFVFHVMILPCFLYMICAIHLLCHAMNTLFQICFVLDVVNILHVMLLLMLMRRPP